jgi:small ligand-binding sensory domain FIST
VRFASSITDRTELSAALEALFAPAERVLTPGMVDLAVLFATGHYIESLDGILDRISRTYTQALVLGCTACGVVGRSREIENGAGISLFAATLPDVRLFPFHLNQRTLSAAHSAHDWERIVGVSPESKPVFVALADPFRLNVFSFIDQVNAHYPGAPLLGGVASAAHKPGGNRLFLNGDVYEEGVLGLAMAGDVVVETVVSQGCRPIGTPFVVTRGEQNIIRELGGRAPLLQLDGVIGSLGRDEKELARKSLLVGRAIDEYKRPLTRGDFLIQSITGADRQSGALAIAGHVSVGSTVQFHVRDAQSADEDLREALAPYNPSTIQGALVFSCNGRGTQMWPEPGHDAGVLGELVGDIPMGGMFCAGEFGPVGRRNFVHGFTASIAMFREPTAAGSPDTAQASAARQSDA